MQKVLTVENIRAIRIERIPFKGKFLDAFGQPQNRGVWFIWGSSGGGKSTFTMDLCRALADHYKVFYNCLEEEPDDAEFIERLERSGMMEVKHNFYAQRYNYEELILYLDKRNAPKVVVLDSLTYLTRDFNQYLELKRRYKDIIFIVTGHAKGSNPKEEIEIKVQYDARMKIFVSGYLASCKGRTIGVNGGSYIVWEEGYARVKGVTQETLRKHLEAEEERGYEVHEETSKHNLKKL